MRPAFVRCVTAALIAAALVGCASDAATRGENDSDAIRAHDRKLCTDYGFRIGAEDFAHCMQALRDQRAHSAR